MDWVNQAFRISMLSILVSQVACTKNNVSPVLEKEVVQFQSVVPTTIPDVGTNSATRTIRVRLFPLLSVPNMEPYPETVNFNEIEVLNDEGLELKRADGSVLATGIAVRFDFKNAKIFVLPAVRTKQVELVLEKVLVVPVEGVDSLSKVIWNKGLTKKDDAGATKSIEVNLAYRGMFAVEPSWVPRKLTAEGITVDEEGNEKKENQEVWVDEYYWSLINHLSIESYLYSVIPSEVYPSWPATALEAQSLAARTYAARHMVISRVINRPWDVDPTTRFQSYRGAALEKASTNQAVDATAGVIMTYKGTVIEASYSANSGGIVCSSGDCFGIAKPYLQAKLDVEGIRDVADGSGRWSAVTKPEAIRGILKDLDLNSAGFTRLSYGRLGDAIETTLSPSRRVWTLFAEFKDGSKYELPYRLGKKTMNRYRSALYTISEPNSAGVQSVSGFGFGHGVGMSQWGAYLLSAKHNKSAEEIVKFYYDGIELAELP